MESTNIIKLFLASPSDVKMERDLIFNLKDDLDHLVGKPNKIRFEFVNWERSAYPGVGEDPQDVINKAIKEDYDIFLGIFWKRFGTATNRAESGTIEEFNIAYKKFNLDPSKTHIMLYFKTASPKSIYDIDYDQFAKVKEFKNKLTELGVLYWEYEKEEELKNIIQIHLASIVRDKFGKKESVDENNTIKVVDKYELLSEQIDANQQNYIEGIIDLNQTVVESMSVLTIIVQNITRSMKLIGNKFRERTSEITKITTIKDDRLRTKKLTESLNKLSVDLDQYSDDIEKQLPDFIGKLSVGVESFTKLVMLSNDLTSDTENELKTIFPSFYKSTNGALEGVGNFLEQLLKMPQLSSKFGFSKHRAELATNEVLKELIKAKKIMNQLIKE